MGCDGGTIPRRDELVRLKKKPEQKDKDADRAAKWKHCAISQEPLQQPIVACELGRLYKKDAVIEFLLDRSKFEGAASFDHIKGLKDVKQLQLTENPGHQNPKSDKGDAYVDRATADYICPITGLEMSGKFKFCYLRQCGCVFSERALKEVKTDTCNKCGKPYIKDDIIVLNGSEEEVEELRTRMEQRRLQAKLDKKAKKKHKLEAAEGCADGSSTIKKTKYDTEGPSTSKTANGLKEHKDSKSKLANGIAGSSSKAANGKTSDKLKLKSVQNDPKASKAYKSLFTSSAAAQNQPKGHWVTYNPCFY